MLDEVDGPALRAWQVFQDQMQIRYGRCPGRNTYFHDRFRGTYRRIAEMCAKYDVSVDDYMLNGFDLLTKASHQYITPKDFVNKEKVMKAYLGNRGHYGDDALSMWLLQESAMIDCACRMVPGTYDNEEGILLDPDTPLAFWFRPLYPHVYSVKLFKIYGRLAWATLRNNRQLGRVARKQSQKNLAELEIRWGILDDIAINGGVDESLHA